MVVLHAPNGIKLFYNMLLKTACPVKREQPAYHFPIAPEQAGANKGKRKVRYSECDFESRPEVKYKVIAIQQTYVN